MLIRMNTLASGPNGSYLAGQVYDLPAAQAQEFIAGNYAAAVTEVHGAPEAAPAAALIETADSPPVVTETAVSAGSVGAAPKPGKPGKGARHATAPRDRAGG